MVTPQFRAGYSTWPRNGQTTPDALWQQTHEDGEVAREIPAWQTCSSGQSASKLQTVALSVQSPIPSHSISVRQSSAAQSAWLEQDVPGSLKQVLVHTSPGFWASHSESSALEKVVNAR